MNRTSSHPVVIEPAFDAILQQHFERPPQPPPADIITRAGEAALQALDVLSLQDARPRFSDKMASLSQHITELAVAAGVSLQEIVRTLRLPPKAENSATAARSWAWLACILGLDAEEVDLRLRWGFAFGEGLPVRSRQEQGHVHHSLQPDDQKASEAQLREAEKNYLPQQRKDLDILRAAARGACSDVT